MQLKANFAVHYFYFIFVSTCATFLQTQPGQDLLELGVCAELGQLDVHAAAQAGSQVRGAGQDVAQMLVPHEAVVVLLEDLLNLAGKKEGRVSGDRHCCQIMACVDLLLMRTLCRPMQKRLKTSLMLPPFCMEMTRR